MRRSRFASPLSVSVVAFLCCTIASARAADMAGVMPCDTAIYLGWSQQAEKDSSELRARQKLLKAAGGLIEEKGGEPGAEKFAMLLDVLPVLKAGSVGIGLFDVTMVERKPNIEAALVVDAGADSALLAETMHNFIAAMDSPENIDRHVIKDVALECIHLGRSPMYLVWGQHEHYFLVALGDGAAAKVIDCINGQAANLADTDELKFDRNKVKAQVDGRHFCLYVDTQRVISRAKAIASEVLGGLPATVDPALNELGLTALRSKYLHIDRLDDQPRIMAFAHVDGPRKGLLKLWDQKPLSDDDLKIVPQDAYWAEVGNLDLAALWKEALRVLEALAPDKTPLVEGPLAMVAQLVGFSITDDLLPAFGDTWAIFDAPEHGGILLSGTVLVAEVNDSEKLQGMLARLVQFLTPLAMQVDATLKLKQVQHGEHTIHYVLVGGVPCPIAPAWSFVGQRWVFGLFPQTVATAAKQVDPKTRGASLLDHPDFRAARAKLPKDAQGIGYYDSRYFSRMFYPFLTALGTLGTSMLAKHGAELDLTLMPPLPEFAAKVTNFVGTSSADSDGIMYASIGSGAPLSIVAGGTALVTSVMLPSLARARELSKRAVSAANLRGIGHSCMVYANDHGDRFPDSLEQLLEEGALTAKQLRSPRDPEEDECSYAYIAGQTTESGPRNVLAYERIYDDGEGTNVLFADGHVEWMKMAEFKRVLRESYRRLGRESEFPPELQESSD